MLIFMCLLQRYQASIMPQGLEQRQSQSWKTSGEWHRKGKQQEQAEYQEYSPKIMKNILHRTER